MSRLSPKVGFSCSFIKTRHENQENSAPGLARFFDNNLVQHRFCKTFAIENRVKKNESGQPVSGGILIAGADHGVRLHHQKNRLHFSRDNGCRR
jgi:hypothetical protein